MAWQLLITNSFQEIPLVLVWLRYIETIWAVSEKKSDNSQHKNPIVMIHIHQALSNNQNRQSEQYNIIHKDRLMKGRQELGEGDYICSQRIIGAWTTTT